MNSKNKGNTNERQCAKILCERFEGKDFRRTPSSGAIFGQSNKIGAGNVDSEIKSTLSGDIVTPIDFKFSIEHKAYKQANFWDLFNEKSDIHSWMKQCENDAEFSNKKPLLVIKYNNKQRICALKEEVPDVIFSHLGWNFLWFSDLLKLEDDFFFEKEKR